MASKSRTARFRRSAIADLLRAEGISASDLARRIGVSRQVVAAYRAGNKTPQLQTVVAMSEEFNQPLDFFVEHERQGK